MTTLFNKLICFFRGKDLPPSRLEEVLAGLPPAPEPPRHRRGLPDVTEQEQATGQRSQAGFFDSISSSNTADAGWIDDPTEIMSVYHDL